MINYFPGRPIAINFVKQKKFVSILKTLYSAKVHNEYAPLLLSGSYLYTNILTYHFKYLSFTFVPDKEFGVHYTLLNNN